MKATIWHNPNCGTSRSTLAALVEAGADVTIVEYLKTPPSRDALAELYTRAGITPREGLRMKDALVQEPGLEQADDDHILDAMIEHPILIERPLVETDKGVRLCRPADRVQEIL